MSSVTRHRGITRIVFGNVILQTDKINRFAFNRLRKLAASGKLQMWHIRGAMRSKASAAKR